MKCNRCGKENVDPVYPHTCTPLALKLADEITESPWPETYVSEVAAELRRLHAENEALRTALQDISAYYPNSWASDTARAALAWAGEVK